MKEESEVLHPFIGKYLRKEVMPHGMCPGCGNMTIANALIRAIDKKFGSFDKFVFVSGIGCAAWIPSPHFLADTVHVLHGRAIPTATGIKLANPDLNVIVISGDGDLAAIGGNHLFHAARRNIDIIVILVNNFNYGMTGGQLAPTTPFEAKTITTPYGNIEDPFDLPRLMVDAGANYVARWTVIHVLQLERSFEKALEIEGFRFIEVLSPCTTRYVRWNLKDSLELLNYFKNNSVNIKVASDEDIKRGKIIVGEFIIRKKEGYLSRYRKIKENALKSWGLKQ